MVWVAVVWVAGGVGGGGVGVRCGVRMVGPIPGSKGTLGGLVGWSTEGCGWGCRRLAGRGSGGEAARLAREVEDRGLAARPVDFAQEPCHIKGSWRTSACPAEGGNHTYTVDAYLVGSLAVLSVKLYLCAGLWGTDPSGHGENNQGGHEAVPRKTKGRFQRQARSTSLP